LNAAIIWKITDVDYFQTRILEYSENYEKTRYLSESKTTNTILILDKLMKKILIYFLIVISC